MKELREAAERYRKFRSEYSAEAGFSCSDERVTAPLCDAYLKFTDPTPLAELTDEQWKGLGFQPITDTKSWLFRLSRLIPFDIVWDLDNTSGSLVFDDGFNQTATNAKTAGQLRHLMAAIGGE